MRVALIVREDCHSAPGGDIDQIEALAQALRGQGHEALLVPESRLELSGCVLALLFNLTRPEDAYGQARACLAAGVPYLVFPVYWDHDTSIPPQAYPDVWRRRLLGWLPGICRDAMLSLRYHWRRRRARIAQPCRLPGILYSRRELMGYTLRNALRIGVMSRLEIGALRGQFGELGPDSRFLLAPNGIWSGRLPGIPAGPRERKVLCAGAFGPRKNQLNLIRAARGLDAQVEILGYATPAERAYERLLRREAPPNVRFLERKGRPEYLALLGETAVYAQPSYFELPGLASLEAAAMGCRLVLTEGGTVRDYFGGQAQYVDPADPCSIRAGLAAALDLPRPPDGLAERIRGEYDWERCLLPFARMVGDLGGASVGAPGQACGAALEPDSSRG